MKKIFIVDRLAEFIGLLIFNLVVFFISKIFVDDLTVFNCFLYSLFNSVWMLFTIIPLLNWLNKRKSDKEFSKKFGDGLRGYIDDFNKRQKTIQEALDNDVYLIEERTSYSEKLIQELLNDFSDFGFATIKDVAKSFLKSKTTLEKNKLWSELNNGVAILQTADQLNAYVYSYGKMHELKLNDSFNKLFSTINFSEYSTYSIIDYGCGQGIATTIFLSYLKRHKPRQKQIEKIILIEPSLPALKRGSLHVLTTLKPLKQNPKIETINKQLDDVVNSELQLSYSSIKLHLFSNILDVTAFDIATLQKRICDTQSGENIFVCVSPKINSTRNDRLNDFYNLFLPFKPNLISNRDNPINTLMKRYQRHEIIFKVNL